MLSLVLPLAFPLLPVHVEDTEVTLQASAASVVVFDQNRSDEIGDPELWFSLPSSGVSLTPVLLFGMNFANEGYSPRFGLTPSIPLFQFGVELPFIGKPSFMLTSAAPGFPGEVDLYLKRGLLGRETNRLTWTYL